MSERRVLVIGSQCEKLNRLSFLPEAAKELYSVMIAADLGGCSTAIPGRRGLLLDPTVNEAITAIEVAFQQAAEMEATLFLALIGHGDVAGRDFYFLPRDATVPPRSHSAVHLVQLIKELHGQFSTVDGLVVLLDTCYSGIAAAGAAARWVEDLAGTLRFEVLTAAADRPAADGCFSRNLARLLRQGLASVPLEYIRCEHARREVSVNCPNQVPQLPAYNADEGLYLARNTTPLEHHPPVD